MEEEMTGKMVLSRLSVRRTTEQHEQTHTRFVLLSDRRLDGCARMLIFSK
jgi:hypothetical protein